MEYIYFFSFGDVGRYGKYGSLGDSQGCSRMLFGKSLDQLTFLSKKKTPKESPLQPTTCVLCGHFLPIFMHISCPRGACSRCSHAFQKIEWCVEEIPSGWCGLWKSKSGCLVGPSIVADFLKNHGWCGLIMVPYLLYRLPPLDVCCWRSFIAGCA